jgi:hypothetical protein
VEAIVIIDASNIWKLALALALGIAIFISAYATAPRESVSGADLRRLVFSAIALYLVGLLASVTHHALLAAIVYSVGIAVCALAVWLSRGSDPEDPPPGGEEPTDERPPPSPDGVPEFDWASFEQAFRSYADRDRVGPRD